MFSKLVNFLEECGDHPEILGLSMLVGVSLCNITLTHPEEDFSMYSQSILKLVERFDNFHYGQPYQTVRVLLSFVLFHVKEDIFCELTPPTVYSLFGCACISNDGCIYGNRIFREKLNVMPIIYKMMENWNPKVKLGLIVLHIVEALEYCSGVKTRDGRRIDKRKAPPQHLISLLIKMLYFVKENRGRKGKNGWKDDKYFRREVGDEVRKFSEFQGNGLSVDISRRLSVAILKTIDEDIPIAFCMARHKRIGEDSAFHELPVELFSVIFDFL